MISGVKVTEAFEVTIHEKKYLKISFDSYVEQAKVEDICRQISETIEIDVFQKDSELGKLF